MANLSPRGYKNPSTEAEINDPAFWRTVGENQDARFVELYAQGKITKAQLDALGVLAGFTPGDVHDAEMAAALAQSDSLSQDVVSGLIDGATASLATKAEVTTELNTRVAPVVAGIIADDPTVAQNAANLAQSTAGIIRELSPLANTSGAANAAMAVGVYRNRWGGSNSATQGLPENAGQGVLEVTPIDGPIVNQQYVSTSGRTWNRVYTGAAWGAWVELARLESSGLYRTRSTLTGSGTINGLLSMGIYQNPITNNATNIAQGLPENAGQGVLEVLTVASPVTIHRYTSASGRVWSRVYTGAEWGLWVELARLDGSGLYKVRPALTGSGNVNGLLSAGIYPNPITDEAANASQGLPAGATSGVLEIMTVTGGTVIQRYTDTSSGGTPWTRSHLGDGLWTQWTKAGTGGGGGGSPLELRGLYERTRPTPDGSDTGLITPLAMDPNVPGRMWSQGARFGHLGYGPVSGETFTRVEGSQTGLPQDRAITGLHFSATHLWATMGPMEAGKGTVWRSPLPNADMSGGHGLTFTQVFDIENPPAGITTDVNAFWRNASLATDETGQRVMLLEYGLTLVNGPSVFFSADAGDTWDQVHTFSTARHGHGIKYRDGEWWVQNGDAGWEGTGMWSAADSEPFVWERRSVYLHHTGKVEHGINFQWIPMPNGTEKMVTESDTLQDYAPLFLDTDPNTGPRHWVISDQMPVEYHGTIRQLTYDRDTGNLYYYQTSETGKMNDTDSIWMLPPPYTKAILLEVFPHADGFEAQGDPVIWGDYYWHGKNRIRKELTTGQV
ncbi:pyocin knob domain-containing protein [Citricoccus nitrophenolicus]|uniref:Pyocin knob domain-containing protein n=1 Tax=Citricoccus nitrophenolicus TaxID=863575 RepID=A0ABV0IFL6_9MICC